MCQGRSKREPLGRSKGRHSTCHTLSIRIRGRRLLLVALSAASMCATSAHESVVFRRSATAAGLAVKAHYDVDRRGDGGASGLPREAVRQAPCRELTDAVSAEVAPIPSKLP